MSNSYSVKPVSRHATGMHRWMVVDLKRMVCVRFTVTRDEAERIARTMTMTPMVRARREKQIHCS